MALRRVASTGAPSAATAAVTTAPAAAAASIKSIDFRRSATGAGQLVVQLSDPHTPINLRQEGSQIVVDFSGTALPQRLTRRFDTLDFGTPVTGFEAESVNGNARIVLDATGNFDQLAYQTDDQYVVEVSPVQALGSRCRDCRDQEELQGRAPDAELPGHLHTRGAAAAG